MAQLLVSVRSAPEAKAAMAGGAAIVDVKEPSRGSLGMAPIDTWRRVREAVPASVVVTVALGELRDWAVPHRFAIPPDAWQGIRFRKVGLSRAEPDWQERWTALRRSWEETTASVSSNDRPGCVAVVYLDWQEAGAPDPASIIAAAGETPECPGVLFDTWNKTHRVEFGLDWMRWIVRTKESGRFVALAGSLDEAAIRRLRPLEPDIFAVRGAACRDGDRSAHIDADRVGRLVEAASG